jgi:hypothetical protein
MNGHFTHIDRVYPLLHFTFIILHFIFPISLLHNKHPNKQFPS